MKLVASVMTKNEIGRYLEPFISHLLEFCDEVRVLDDGSDDGTYYWLGGLAKPVIVKPNPGPAFFEHEGRARQNLLEWTLDAEPTHVLSIDADEFVSDGAAVRAACESENRVGVWTLLMEEVWKASPAKLQVRHEGGWRPHPVPILWSVPPQPSRAFRIRDRALACGREPIYVAKHAHRAQATGVSVLHFGWTREAEREQRYQRYVTHDGGKFHASAHLQSIMWPDSRVRLRNRRWPKGLTYQEVMDGNA